MSANLRQLGKSGPLVPALSLGLMGFGSPIYGAPPSDGERFALLDQAFELGATFWDTSDMYGDSEATIGQWFQRTGKRDKIFLATKFGYIKDSPTFEVDSSAEHCKKCCDRSLKTLGVDSIDLYYVHAVNPKTPIEQSMRAMAELQAEGKIKHIGLSNIGSNDLRRAVKIAPVAAVQIEYSPFAREIEGPIGTHLMATCRELGVAIVAYSPLGRGILTSSFNNSNAAEDPRAALFPRFQGENRDKNAQVINQFGVLAKRKGCTIAQFALSWLLKQGNDVFPIAGTKKVRYLQENWGALDVHLTDEEEADARAFLESTGLDGGLLPEWLSDRLWPTTVEES
ncbi:putative aldo-keto reductase [Xylariales sp. PMI_506]|nr:putative aldo-keto reductase [Xylariales sp. PMI_506]